MQSDVSSPGATAHDRLSAGIDTVLNENGAAPLAVLAEGILTRADALRESNGLIGRFSAAGLCAGDRIALFCRDDRTLILHVIAALRAGVCFVVGDPDSTDSEVRELITTCRPAAVFADRHVPEPDLPGGARWHGFDDGAAIRPVADRLEGRPDLAMMIFTSGTTSTAKAVALSYGNLLAQLDIFADVYGFCRETRLLNLLPLHHTDGLTRGPVAALWFGGVLVRPFRFSVQKVPALLEMIAPERITHLVAVPALLRILLRAGRDRPAAFRTVEFRFVVSSADVLDAALWTCFESRFGIPVVNAYGLSEVVCDALFAGPSAEDRVPGTIGRPVGVTASVVDAQGERVPAGEVGELVLAGPTVMRGYFEAPELTDEALRDGALRTGDLVRIRPDGLFEFIGRRKTAIVSSGVTIHPEGTTAVLAQMPGVLEAHAFGLSDPDRGERLVAAVVPVPGSGIGIAEVRAFCGERISAERMPHEIRLLDVLPRSAAGKVLVSELAGSVQPRASGPTERPLTVYDVAARCLDLPVESLDAASSPFNTPGWDSFAHMSLITEIEEVFEIVFSPQEIAEFGCLGDAEAIISATHGG